MLAIKLTKDHKRILEAVSREPARPVLTGVHVTPEYIEAADGYILLRIPVDKVEGVDCEGEAIVPANIFRDGLKLIKGKYGEAILKIDGTSVELHAEGSMMAANTVPGKYPNITEIAEKARHDGENVFATAMAPEYLQALARVARAGNGTFARLQSAGPQGPIRFDTSNGAYGVIMPVTKGAY